MKLLFQPFCLSNVNYQYTGYKYSLFTASFILLFFAATIISCGTDELPSFDGSVSGTVTDRITGEAISGCKIELRQGGNTVQVTSTSIDGNFRLVDQVKGEENYTILASASGYNDLVIDEFTLSSGNNVKEADIQMDPLTPILIVVYAGGLQRLEIDSNTNTGEVRVENSGDGNLSYTLDSPSWLNTKNSLGNKQGSIGGGNSALITITGVSSAIDNLNLSDGESRSAQVVLQTEQEVEGERIIEVLFTYYSGS